MYTWSSELNGKGGVTVRGGVFEVLSGSWAAVGPEQGAGSYGSVSTEAKTHPYWGTDGVTLLEL